MSVRKRIWYHCSEQDHGSRLIVARRVPRVAASSEPSTPRLCVGPSIASCFAARLFVGKVYVYATETKRSAIRPTRVWDQLITGECWLIPPARLVKVQEIDQGMVAEIFAAVRLYHGCTRKRADFRTRIAQFAIAISNLPHNQREAWLVSTFSERWGIGANPEEYLLNRAIAESCKG